MGITNIYNLYLPTIDFFIKIYDFNFTIICAASFNIEDLHVHKLPQLYSH